MEKENTYSNSLRKLSDEELINYVDKPDEYEEEAVIAAIWELQKRKKANKKTLATLALIEENRIKTTEQQLTSIPFRQEDLTVPVLYSKNAIRFFSIFFSTLFGGILLSINLNRIHKNREIFFVMSFSILYTYSVGVVASYYPEYILFIALFMYLLGLIILEEIFWKRLIGNDLKYQKQPVWLALGIAFLFVALLLWTMMNSGNLKI